MGILEQEADERFISDPRCNDRFEEFRRLCANVARYHDHSWLVTRKRRTPSRTQCAREGKAVNLVKIMEAGVIGAKVCLVVNSGGVHLGITIC